MMRLMQWAEGGVRTVVVREGDGRLCRLHGADSVYALVQQALDSAQPLAQLVADRRGTAVDEAQLFADGNKLLPPLDHPQAARMMISGTGLTHLGSAEARDNMHTAEKNTTTAMTDSIRMFALGIQGGKPPAAQFYGAQPEWFYKGDGNNLAAPGDAIERPAYADDGGEEAEIVGLYIIDRQQQPRRIGFALGNEFSDHIMEKQNYLYLAHSKLRQCAMGPELLLGDLPPAIKGTAAIRRDSDVIWQKPFYSGEDNMCHSIANLERHHFKYDAFCRPGNLHAHFFGTATLSFADGVSARDGDEFIIESDVFGLPLINRLRTATALPQRDVLPL